MSGETYFCLPLRQVFSRRGLISFYQVRHISNLFESKGKTDMSKDIKVGTFAPDNEHISNEELQKLNYILLDCNELVEYHHPPSIKTYYPSGN